MSLDSKALENAVELLDGRAAEDSGALHSELEVDSDSEAFYSLSLPFELNERFGRFLTLETARKALGGISLSDFEALVTEGCILRVKTSDGVLLYPELQFDGEGSLLQGLAPIVSTLLSAVDGWTVLYWLTAPDEYTGHTAIDALRAEDSWGTEVLLNMAKNDALRWSAI